MKLFEIDPIDVTYRDARRTVTVLGVRLPWLLPLASMVNSSGAVILGAPFFGGGRSKSRFWSGLYRLALWVDAAHRWFMYRFQRKHRYHLIDTRLKPGYYDIDHLLLHGAMSLLRRYVEDEHGGEDKLQARVDFLRDEARRGREAGDADVRAEYANAAGEVRPDERALEIYRWWMYERVAEHALYESRRSAYYGGSRLEFIDDENPLGKRVKIHGLREDLGYDSGDLYREERALDERDDEMLKALVDIRQSLWT